MMLSYLAAYVRSNRIKALLMLSSLILYFLAVAMSATMSNSIADVATLPMKSIGAETVVQRSGKIPNQMVGAIFPHSNAPIYPHEIAQIASSSFLTGYDSALYFWYFDNSFFKSALGVHMDEGIYADILKNNVVSGKYPDADNEILATEDFIRKTGVGLGESISMGADQLTISGVLRSQFNGNIAPADLYLNIDSAQRIAGRSSEMKDLYNISEARFYNMLVLKTDPLWRGDLEEAIKAHGDGYLVFGTQSFATEISDQLLFLSSSATLAFVMIGVLLLISFSLMVFYGIKARENEIALLRMMGWTFRKLRHQFMGESLIIVGVALLLGNILYGLALKLLSTINVTMELPWDISAKPHFLPSENNIERTISAPLPVNFDIWTHLAINLGMIATFAILTYLLLYRLKNINPAAFYKT